MNEHPDVSKPGDITHLLRRLRDGDHDAFDRLLPIVYSTLKELSRHQLQRRSGNTLSTTELVHETYIKMAGRTGIDWESRSHFFAVAARAMRQVLVDHARRRAAVKRGGGGRITVTGRNLRFELRWDELLALDEALERLSELNARLRKVVELRFFGGLEEREVADALGVSTRTVERDWVKARLFLHRELYPEAGAGGGR